MLQREPTIAITLVPIGIILVPIGFTLVAIGITLVSIGITLVSIGIILVPIGLTLVLIGITLVPIGLHIRKIAHSNSLTMEKRGKQVGYIDCGSVWTSDYIYILFYKMLQTHLHVHACRPS
jgi:hypothetical protein